MCEDPPIPYAMLRDLFERLDRTSMTGYQCDHSFALTRQFLKEQNVPIQPMLDWLGENGAGCDCEVMMNTAVQWEEIVGYVPPDDDE